MNAFQRPAMNGKSIVDCELDRKIAQGAVRHVLKVLRPRYVCVASSKVWRAIFCNIDTAGFECCAVAHAASAWWNRRNRHGANGRLQFRNFIQNALRASQRGGSN